jgi:AraC family L-rhamnose operon transcriptional activator RhaR
MNMNWLERLNHLPGRISLNNTVENAPGAALTVYNWAYDAHLADNYPHRHTYYEICLVGEYGSGIFSVENKPFEIEPGDLFLARPGVMHQITNTQPELMELYWVCFSIESASGCGSVGSLTGRFAEASDILVVPDTGDCLGQIWRALRASASAPAYGTNKDALLTSLVTALLLGILEAGSGPLTPLPGAGAPSNAGANTARNAVRFIHDNLSSELRISVIADEVGVSPRHLSRLLCSFTGVPPAEYIEMARMDRARTLLLRTDDAIKHIASLVGYSDVHHFTRVFARRVGCPPGVYRRTLGAADQSARGSNIQRPGALV